MRWSPVQFREAARSWSSVLLAHLWCCTVIILWSVGSSTVRNTVLPIVGLLVCSFLRYQVIILLCSISLPVRNLLSHCLGILYNYICRTPIVLNQSDQNNHKMIYNKNLLFFTLAASKGSLCSWSRYFSMLKKVSKKIWESWHLFRSLRVIFPDKKIKQTHSK